MSSIPQSTNPSDAPGEARSKAADRLEGRLRDLASDRVASARSVAMEAARELHSWALEQPLDWSFSSAAIDLEQGWSSWRGAHAWRGACARLVEGVRRHLDHATQPREALLGETRAWIDGETSSEARLVPLESLIPHAQSCLHYEDWVLVHGYSELCVKSLAAAQHAGLAPRVLVTELAADASGKRMARELLPHGVQVRLTWDLAAIDAVEEVDQVWFGTETVGAGVFVGYVGTSLLLERARSVEVPSRVLATSSDVQPGGVAHLPPWGEAETDGLWCFPPEGVELCSQPYELVDADRVDCWITEAGWERFADLSLRALHPQRTPALTHEC